MQQVINDGFGFQQHSLPAGINKRWGIQPVQSFTWVLFGGPTLCHLESTMSTASVFCGVRDRTRQLDNDHDVACTFSIVYCYLVVCYILLLVTDKLEMTTCLADKM